jgi:hypothetical protein
VHKEQSSVYWNIEDVKLKVSGQSVAQIQMNKAYTSTVTWTLTGKPDA